MANYLYNGVELPELPEWNKTVYPKSLIVKSPSYTYYEFYCAKGISSLGSDIVLKGGHTRWICLEGGTQWEEKETMSGHLIILSRNVLWDDGDPAPVPVVPEITTFANSYVSDSGKWSQNDYYERVNGEWVKRQAYARMDGKWTKVVKAKEIAPDNCLTFSSAEPFTIATYNTTKNWDGTLYYSTDTTTWSEWSGKAAIESAEHGAEQRIYMRGSGNSVITGNDNERRWVLTGSNIACVGNIENLLDYETVANGNHPTMAEDCYRSMFRGCTSLTSAPELPATTLTAYCYKSMFYGCKNIKLSTTQTDEYQTAYRIPTSGTVTTVPSFALDSMFTNTGGTFTGTPSINTTYYTSNTVV